MSTIDQAVIDTASATLAQAIISGIQMFIAIIAIFFAYIESRKWRRELLGNKKIDVAIRLGNSALKVKQAFRLARSSEINNITNVKIEEYREAISQAIDELLELKWEASLLFDEEEHIDEAVAKLVTKNSELLLAWIAFSDGRETENDHRIRISDPNNDDFGKAIHKTTENILRIVYKYTK